MEEQSEHHSSKIDLQTHDPAERTKEYVDEQAKRVTYQPTHAPEGVSTGSDSQQATVVQSTYKATERWHKLEDKPSHSRERVSVVGSQAGRTETHISHSSGRKRITDISHAFSRKPQRVLQEVANDGIIVSHHTQSRMSD